MSKKMSPIVSEKQTIRTVESFVVRFVNFPVINELIFPGTGIRTLGTFKGFLACVKSLMINKISLAYRCVRTFWTLKRFDVGMSFLMPHEMRLVSGRVGTLPADPGFICS